MHRGVQLLKARRAEYLAQLQNVADPNDTKALDEYKQKIADVDAQLKKYDPKTLEAANKSLAKSQNDLNAALKDTAAQLSAGTISPLEAATKNLQAYQKDLTSLFKNGGAKQSIESDIAAINKLNAAIASSTAADILSKQQAFFGNQDILVKVGGEDDITSLQNKLQRAKSDLDKLVTGNHKLNLDSAQVKDAQQTVTDLSNKLDDLKADDAFTKSFSGYQNTLTSLKNELDANLITPLEYAQQAAAATKSQIKSLLDNKSNPVSADNPLITGLQFQLGGYNADAATQQMQVEIDKVFATLSAKKEDLDIQASINPHFTVSGGYADADKSALMILKKKLQEELSKGINNTPLSIEIANLEITYKTDALRAQVDAANKQLNSTLADLAGSSIEALGGSIRKRRPKRFIRFITFFIRKCN